MGRGFIMRVMVSYSFFLLNMDTISYSSGTQMSTLKIKLRGAEVHTISSRLTCCGYQIQSRISKLSKAMACLGSNSLNLHRLRSSIQSSSSSQSLNILSTSTFALPPQQRRRRFSRLACQTNPDPIESPTSEEPISEPTVKGETNQFTDTTQNAGFSEFPNKNINRRIAIGSTLGAVGLFLSRRLDFGVSLKDLSAIAIPYEEALSNGMPTVVEFYADWCEVCRELAPDVYKVEQQYRDRVNFVMLNVDNTKWEQELDEFGVEGIPHFAFLDREGNEEGNVVGKIPRTYLFENVDALARGEPSIPHARIVGQYTSAESRTVHKVVDPRSHG